MFQNFKVCKCLPWYYPNDFTGIPICEMFGASCFDKFMSDTSNHHKCSDMCLENCKQVLYVPLPSYMPLDQNVICSRISKTYLEYLKEYQSLNKIYDAFSVQTEKFKMPNLEKDELEECKEYVKNYVSAVTVFSPRSIVTLSKRVKAIGFNDQLSAIGGALGLFTGISILSIVEILCCIIQIFINGGKRHILQKTGVK